MRQSPAFSVLISYLQKEKPEHLIACLNSLLRQTCPADEWVIVEDGPLTQELYTVVDLYAQEHPGLIKRVRLRSMSAWALRWPKGFGTAPVS